MFFVVGYVTYNLTGQKQDMRGVPFLSVGSEGFDVQGIKLSNGSDGSDLIMLWDAATREWTNLYHWNEIYENAEAEESLGEGWGDNEGNIIRKVINPGTAFWITSFADTTVTVPGQVVAATDNDKIQTVGNKQDMIAGVFPTALDIQDISLDNGSDGSDLIMVWDAATRGWTNLYHWNEIYENAEAEESLGEGWGDNEGNIINKTLDPAQGFWITTANDCKVTFKSPL